MYSNYLQEKYQSMREEIIEYAMQEVIDLVEEMSMYELHTLYNELAEDAKQQAEREVRALGVQKKREKQLSAIGKLADKTSSSGKAYSRELSKKFKGAQTANKAMKYYMGDTKPEENPGKGYRAPQSRIK